MRSLDGNHDTSIKFVDHLSDLITEEDYLDTSSGKKIRIQIRWTEKGLEILGDSMHGPLLEKLLAKLGSKEIEKMLCG